MSRETHAESPNNAATPERGELALVRRLRELLDAPENAMPVPFGDDMAPISADQPDLLWTVDMLMDGVDFDSAAHSWDLIGRKAMAVNLSDCAAMAVQPVAALCAVSLANNLSMDDAVALHHGARDIGVRYGCPILGGDTNSWDSPTAVSITVIGRSPAGRRPVRRDGATPGQRIWLTGPVGGSILGRHLTFTPRVDLALQLLEQVQPAAMIDISDGVALDLNRVLEASGCGADIEAALLDAATHSDAIELARDDGHPAREHALYDGEDFELIVIAPEEASTACEQLGLLPLGVTALKPGLSLLSSGGERTTIPIRGWEHFR